VRPTAYREVVGHLREMYEVSERRACGAVGFPRSTCRYPSQRRDDPQLRSRLIELAAERPRFGYRRLQIMLRREDIEVNHKRVYRLYREEGLAVRRKRRKRVARGRRVMLEPATRRNQRWSMDFTGDSLADGRVFRTLNIVDDFTRECAAIVVDTSLPGLRVVRELDQLIESRGTPEMIVMDNGPEFTCKALDEWAYRTGVRLHFIRPGKPVENAYVESFNGKFRDECLNQHWFVSLSHAMEVIENWREDYNEVRPHSSLGQIAPAEFARLQTGLQSPTAPSAPPANDQTLTAELT